MNNNSYVLYRSGKAADYLPLSLRSVGHTTLQPYSCIPDTRTFDFIQFIWCLSGKGAVEYNKQAINISAGYVTAIMPQQSHFLSVLSPDWKIRWITLDGLYASDVVRCFNLGQIATKSGACPFELFQQMEAVVQHTDRTSLLEASSLCYSLLAKASQGSKQGNAIIEKAMTLIRQHANEPEVGIAQVADQLGIERTLFSKQFTSHTGMPPKEYLDSCRLEKVLALLTNTNLPVIEIAAQAGFANANYLAKFFRKKMSMSPIEFRQQAIAEI